MMEKLLAHPTDTTNSTGTSVITGTTDYSVAICGAGPVGLALALLLVRHGMAPQRIALLDAKTLAQSVQDPRSIAISYGSRQILQEVGAWTAYPSGLLGRGLPNLFIIAVARAVHRCSATWRIRSRRTSTG